jgi:hypothetical protein
MAMTYNDERQAARKAQAVITSLTPRSQRTDANVFAIRYAAGTARDAVTNQPHEGILNDARIEASSVLGGLQGLMEVSAVTPDMIERARKAVAAWLRELAVLDR